MLRPVTGFWAGVGIACLLFAETGATDGLRFLTPNGEVAEWFNAAVLKTVDSKGSGGSNPSLSATKNPAECPSLGESKRA